MAFILPALYQGQIQTVLFKACWSVSVSDECVAPVERLCFNREAVNTVLISAPCLFYLFTGVLSVICIAW